MRRLAGEGPRWFTIPAHRPFLRDLAEGVVQEIGDPEALADVLLLTPTRRAARALAETFVGVAPGSALLAPRIRALGDLDGGEPPFEPGEIALMLPAAVEPGRRRFELARIVKAHEGVLGRELSAAGALEMADALAGLLDSLEIEEIEDAPEKIEGLVEGELARHWERSRAFLGPALRDWRARLDELGLVDVAARQARLLRLLAEQWERSPPPYPVIAAGSMATAEAATHLLKVIAALPQGAVVLPGLDQDLADSAWMKVEEQHPQGALRRLLERCQVARGEVQVWRADADRRGRWRRRVINEALRPAEATDDWIAAIAALREEAGPGEDPVALGLSGLSLVAAKDEEEAGAVAALLLREALETPGKTCALVTPDQTLARRVSARLARWGVVADSSAGAPLAGFAAGVLVALAARAAADPTDPVTLLGLVKHPLVRLGLAEDAYQRQVRALERYVLRGPRRDDWAGLNRALDRREREGEPSEGRSAAIADARALLAQLEGWIAPLAAVFDAVAPVPEATRALVRTIEALAEDEGGDRGGLWAGPDGEAAAGLLAGLIRDGEALPPATALGFRDLIEALLAGETVRTGDPAHPRVQILGLIEARLVRADLLVLAGLEEGVWPRAPGIDPFLSRPMRATLGLPPPERRVGLSAHDFAQGASAPQVVLLHARRRDGSPAVESRWLWRLRTLARGAGVDIPGRDDVLAWARALDAPLVPAPATLRTAPRPNPKPPLQARPRKLPVTAVERWVRDPYAVYARTILGLRALDRPDAPVEAMLRGTAIHSAFERFALDHPDLEQATAERFAGLLSDALAEAGMARAALPREHARARRMAEWVLEFERRRRPGATLAVEQSGQMVLARPGGDFTLTAKADRLELRGAHADILDFKTGLPPTRKQMDAGLSPQLTLTAAILASGGFGARMAARELVYVRVSGGRTPGEELVRAAEGEAEALAQAALEGLIRRIDLFDDPERGYTSWAAAQFIARHESDYDHLARLWEWHVIGDGEAEA